MGVNCIIHCIIYTVLRYTRKENIFTPRYQILRKAAQYLAECKPNYCKADMINDKEVKNYIMVGGKWTWKAKLTVIFRTIWLTCTDSAIMAVRLRMVTSMWSIQSTEYCTNTAWRNCGNSGRYSVPIRRGFRGKAGKWKRAQNVSSRAKRDLIGCPMTSAATRWNAWASGQFSGLEDGAGCPLIGRLTTRRPDSTYAFVFPTTMPTGTGKITANFSNRLPL